MSKYLPLWQQANSYAATLDRSLIGTLYPNGGVSGAAVAAVANTMNMQAQPGTAVVPLQAGQGCVLCRWDAAGDSTVTLPAAPPSGQSRIDLYGIQVRDNQLDAGGNNDFIFTSVTGTPASSAPATPPTPTNFYVLATVLVPGAAANLNTATVTLTSLSLNQPPGTLIGTTRAAPAAQTSYSVTGAAIALPAFAVTFIVPASGRVLVRWSGFVNIPAGATLVMQWYIGATAQPGGAYVGGAAGGSVMNARAHMSEVVSGLTPGTVVTLTPNAVNGGGVGPSSMYYGGPGGLTATNNAGPAITEVFAA